MIKSTNTENKVGTDSSGKVLNTSFIKTVLVFFENLQKVIMKRCDWAKSIPELSGRLVIVIFRQACDTEVMSLFLL